MGTERLDKVLANMGYGSRKEVKALIKKEEIKINGNLPRDFGMHIDPEVDVIEVFGEKLNYKKYIYIMMNKPKGVITATYDEREMTVIDLLGEDVIFYSPSPVGRLDKDTVGLLLLTNDGELNHLLLSPKRHVSKKYYAKIRGRVTDNEVAKFSEGVLLDDGYKTLPSKLEILVQGEFSEVYVTIYEGKYHQVKRMFEAFGMEVVYLKRLMMGPLKLDETLNEGEYRELTNEEVNSLIGAVSKKEIEQ